MKYVVTGAAGFIGTHLVDSLLAEDHEVIAVDNFDDYYSGKMRFLEPHMKDKNFQLLTASVLEQDLMTKTFHGADAVVHLAAQAGVRASIENPMKAHTVNGTGTLSMLLAAKDAGVKRVVNSSSSSVYGDAKSLPAKEDTQLNPISPYAASKLVAEHYTKQFHDIYGLDTISLRYFTVYGPRQRPDMAIRIFTEHALRGKKPPIFGTGEYSRDFTFISDIIRAIRLSIDCPNPKGRPVNIGSGNPVTVNHIAFRILELCGRKDLGLEYLPPKAGDVAHTWGDISLAKELLGWNPSINIEEGLGLFVKWYKENIMDGTKP